MMPVSLSDVSDVLYDLTSAACECVVEATLVPVHGEHLVFRRRSHRRHK